MTAPTLGTLTWLPAGERRVQSAEREPIPDRDDEGELHRQRRLRKYGRVQLHGDGGPAAGRDSSDQQSIASDLV